MADREAILNRQEQIWGGLFGPSRAQQLTEQARATLDADPGADAEEVVRAIDAVLHDDDDLDEAGTMRPI
jgi:hypothetical protein